MVFLLWDIQLSKELGFEIAFSASNPFFSVKLNQKVLTFFISFVNLSNIYQYNLNALLANFKFFNEPPWKVVVGGDLGFATTFGILVGCLVITGVFTGGTIFLGGGAGGKVNLGILNEPNPGIAIVTGGGFTGGFGGFGGGGCVTGRLIPPTTTFGGGSTIFSTLGLTHKHVQIGLTGRGRRCT
jgi:hypothetical protein